MRFKEHKILIIIIATIVAIIIVLVINKSRKKVSFSEIYSKSTIEIEAENNKNSKKIIANNLTNNLEDMQVSLKELFNKVRMDIGNLDYYSMDSELNVDYGTLEYIEEYAKDSLDESIDFYDEEGNKISIENTLYNKTEEKVNEVKKIVNGIPVPKDDGNSIEISNDIYHFKIGNYYLIKYYVPFSNYTYYFISKLESTGFKEFNLYVISSNEIYTVTNSDGTKTTYAGISNF